MIRAYPLETDTTFTKGTRGSILLEKLRSDKLQVVTRIRNKIFTNKFSVVVISSTRPTQTPEKNIGGMPKAIVTMKLVCFVLLFIGLLEDSNNASVKPKGRQRRFRNHYSNSPQSTEITNDNRKLDSYGSWTNFLGHSTNPRNSKKGDRGKGKPRVKITSSRKTTPPCPPGPPGPPGPRGPAGAIVTEAHMMTEFRNLVRESAQKRSRRLADNISLIASGIPDLVTAFHVELRNELQIAKKTLHELKNYKSHFGSSGTFARGNDIDYKNGRYIARYTGVYQFSCSLHALRARDANLRPRDSIKLRICINSLCDHNTSLLTVTGLNSNSKIFTTSLHGILLLKAGQYTSVFVENSSGNPITISSQSSFSGLLLGA